MNLEDHLGDIIRKARLMSDVPTAAAAAAVGLTDQELSQLEESGRLPRAINFSALANLVGLDAGKLQCLAEGWLPVPADLSRWRHLRCFTTDEGGMAVNCYLVWDEATRDAALFDTGWNAQPVFDGLDANLLALRHIFITHSHGDHIAALAELRAACPQAQVHSHSRSAPSDQRLRDGETLTLGCRRISFRETPGHAPDGVTYLVQGWPDGAPDVAIVGDTIFAGSIGRGNQSWALAKQKVREHILSLPGSTLLCPGHGPLTTAAEERAHNPFFPDQNAN